MAKTVKIPLVMANGEKASDMKSLIDNFDISSIVGYFLDGKLEKWLTDRYYEDEAEAVSQLDKDDPSLAKKLCEIFGIIYEEADVIDAEELARRNERIARLKQLTDDEEILKNVDSAVFDQEELAELYDKGIEHIILCDGEFRIPKTKQDLDYTILGDAIVTGLPEKNTNLEEIPQPIQNNPTMPQAMSKIINKWENMIAGEDSLIFLGLGFSASGSLFDMFYNESDLHSRYAAEQKAERLFSPIYNSAKEYFSTYGDNSFCKLAAKKLFEIIKNDTLLAADTLNEIDNSFYSSHSNVINELMKLLDINEMKASIEMIAEKEIQDNYYELYSMQTYLNKVEYTELDHSIGDNSIFAALFSTKEYTISGGDAWLALSEDMTKKQEAYEKYVSNAFRREILKPIITLTKKLYEFDN